MKKIIGLVALLLLCIAGTAFAAGVPMVQTTGTIVKVEDDKATIKANEPGKDVALYIGRAPYFIDKQSGKRLADKVARGVAGGFEVEREIMFHAANLPSCRRKMRWP